MPDPITRLNAALEGRYRIESELGEGGMATGRRWSIAVSFSVIGVVTLLAAFVPAVTAQSGPHTREGLFIGLGVGWGSRGCFGGCQGTRHSGLAGYVRLGGGVGDQLLLGLEGNRWRKRTSRREDGPGIRGFLQTQSDLSAVAYVYPTPASGFFVKGGIGISRWEGIDANEGKVFGSGKRVLGITVGVGYDARLTSNLSLTPYATFLRSSFELATNVVQAGLGMTWY